MNCFKFIKNLQAAVFLGGGPQSLPIQTSLEMEMYNENSLKISPSLKWSAIHKLLRRSVLPDNKSICKQAIIYAKPDY